MKISSQRRHPPLSFLVASSLVACAAPVLAIDVNNPPSIHIRHQLVNVSALNMLKSAREMCQLKGKYGVPVDTGQPDWTKMYIETDDEYFEGIKYAIYKKSARYTVNKDCSIKIVPSYSADIDDGTTRFLIDLEKGTSTTRPSVVVTRKKAEASMQGFAKTHPIEAGEIPEALGIDQASQSLQSTSAGSDTVQGVKCDYRSTAQIRDAKVCYWSESHVYPGPLARPIILKSVVTVGQQDNVKQAILFEVGKPLDRTVFSPKI
jgi:hypothetical protein